MGVRTPAVVRIATYNVHRCRGMDRRVSVARIRDVIARLDADVVAVQEILRGDRGGAPGDQVRFIADTLGFQFFAFGETRKLRGSAFGNATFSRFPITLEENYDISWRHRERRGCLRTDVRVRTGTLHVYNVHMGTSMFERPHQIGRLLSDEVLHHASLRGPRVVMGDFNDWTRSVATALMGSRLESIDLRLLGRRRTYPGLLPVLHLDHFYYDRVLQLRGINLDRSRLALVASDHLPLVAEFEVAAGR